MQHSASAKVPRIGSPMTRNQNKVEFGSRTSTPLPSSTAVAPAPATLVLVVVVACVLPFSVDVDIPLLCFVSVAYTVAPPGVQVSMHFASPAPHAGGTGHSVVVSEAFQEMCQGAWAAVQEDIVVSAIVVASSIALTQG